MTETYITVKFLNHLFGIVWDRVVNDLFVQSQKLTIQNSWSCTIICHNKKFISWSIGYFWKFLFACLHAHCYVVFVELILKSQNVRSCEVRCNNVGRVRGRDESLSYFITGRLSVLFFLSPLLMIFYLCDFHIFSMILKPTHSIYTIKQSPSSLVILAIIRKALKNNEKRSDQVLLFFLTIIDS